MSNILSLTKILLKGMFYSSNNKKSKGKMFWVILLFALIGISFVPFAMQTKELTVILGKTGSSFLLETLVIINTIVLVMLSFMSNISVVYLSKDNDTLLYLPIRPREIFAARNIIVIISCYLLTILFFLPSAIGVGIGLKLGVSYYVSVGISAILLPIVPCILTGILTVFIIKALKFVKSKNVLTYAITFIAVGVGVAFSFGTDYLMPVVDESTNAIELINNYKQFINNVSYIFPYAIPLMKIVSLTASATYKIVFLTGIVGILCFLGYLSLIIADKIYFSVLLSTNSLGVKKKKFSDVKFRKQTTQNSEFKSLVGREFKVIFRTPIFFMNIILPVIFPLLMCGVLIPVVGDISQNDLNSISYLLKDYMVYGAIILVLICSFTNFAGSVMYSKDGSSNKCMNYLPIPFMKNFLIKVLFSSMVSFIPYLALVGTIQIIFMFDMESFIFPFMLGLLLIVALNFIAVFIDLNRPKIKWNNETEAVKSNLNVFIYMMIMLIYLAIAFLLEEFAIVLSILTIGTIIALVYRNESKYIDVLS